MDCTKIVVALVGSGGVFTIIINALICRRNKKLELKAKQDTYINCELKKAAKLDVEILRNLAEINENGKAHKKENVLLFKGVLGLMEALQTGHCNGNVASIQKEMKEYLFESGIK